MLPLYIVRYIHTYIPMSYVLNKYIYMHMLSITVIMEKMLNTGMYIHMHIVKLKYYLTLACIYSHYLHSNCYT